jgi:hypothetical protein
VYVGLENGDGVAVLDALAPKEVARIPGGQAPQALVYVSNAVPSGEGRQGLVPLEDFHRPVVVELRDAGGQPQGSAVVRALGPTDALDVSARGLPPNSRLALILEDGTSPRRLLARLQSNAKGAAQAQALGPLRDALAPAAAAEPARARRLIVALEGDTTSPLLSGHLPVSPPPRHGEAPQ